MVMGLSLLRGNSMFQSIDYQRWGRTVKQTSLRNLRNCKTGRNVILRAAKNLRGHGKTSRLPTSFFATLRLTFDPASATPSCRLPVQLPLPPVQ